VCLEVQFGSSIPLFRNEGVCLVIRLFLPNPGACFTRNGHAIIHYWTCEYQPSGAMSNYPIHLKAAIVPIAWLYGADNAPTQQRED
jgi:hypothetical protein